MEDSAVAGVGDAVVVLDPDALYGGAGSALRRGVEAPLERAQEASHHLEGVN